MMSAIFLNFLKDHWETIGAAIMVAILGAWGETMRLERDHARSELVTYQAQVAAQAAEQQKKTAQTEAAWQNQSNDISVKHADEINKIRSYYEKLEVSRRDALYGLSGGVQPKSASGVVLPEIANAPRSIDEVPTDALPLAGQCAETTQQVLDWQDWYLGLVKGQVF